MSAGRKEFKDLIGRVAVSQADSADGCRILAESDFVYLRGNEVVSEGVRGPDSRLEDLVPLLADQGGDAVFSAFEETSEPDGDRFVVYG